MITLWIAAALLAAGAAALMVERAARGARVAALPDPSVEVYRRQLSEIDDLADRGLLADDERRDARAETGRRLLSAADQTPAGPIRTLSPAVVIAVAAAPALVAIGLYLTVGHPGLPDLPFKARVAAWRAHPEQHTPPELAAVLAQVAAERPGDPEPLLRLAGLDIQLGDADGALHALRRATAIAPGRSDLWQAMGEITVLKAGGDVTPAAEAIFLRVRKLDPTSVNARYYLARAAIVRGDVQGGLAEWKAIAAGFTADDPRRPGLEKDIASATATGKPAPLETAGAPPADISGAIHAMVDGLAARLTAHPDDPAGWVRLVRAYSVLGETGKRDAALAEARRRYAGHADILRQLDAALVPPR